MFHARGARTHPRGRRRDYRLADCADRGRADAKSAAGVVVARGGGPGVGAFVLEGAV